MTKQLFAQLIQMLMGYLTGVLGTSRIDPELSTLIIQGAGVLLAVAGYFGARFLWKSEPPSAPLGSE